MRDQFQVGEFLDSANDEAIFINNQPMGIPLVRIVEGDVDVNGGAESKDLAGMK